MLLVTKWVVDVIVIPSRCWCYPIMLLVLFLFHRVVHVDDVSSCYCYCYYFVALLVLPCHVVVVVMSCY